MNTNQGVETVLEHAIGSELEKVGVRPVLDVVGQFVVEKGVPLIPGKTESGRGKYPFNKMEVGDSFLFTGKRSSIGSAACYAAMKFSSKYSIRTVKGGFRVWRVS